MVPEQYEVAPRPPVVEMEGLGPIATLAARMVAPGDAIVLGAGQLVEELARRLSGMAELTVVTNSLRVAEILSRGRTEVVLTGGILRRPHCPWSATRSTARWPGCGCSGPSSAATA